MDETKVMLDELPIMGDSFYFKIPAPNCYVCRDDRMNRIAIFPTQGGALFSNISNVEGDCAPFCD